MAKHNIFKASKLVEALPKLRKVVDGRDFMHVVIVEQAGMFVFVNYVWDTRMIGDITLISTLNAQVQGVREVIANPDDELLADDNLWPLICNKAQYEVTRGLIDELNHDVFTAQPFIPVQVETEKRGKDVYKTYTVGGKVICTTVKKQEYFCSMEGGAPSRIRDKVKTAKSTTWKFDTLNELFGYRDKTWFNDHGFINFSYDVKWGDQGTALSRKLIKLRIAMGYNVRTSKFNVIDESQESDD